jgi:phosphatidylserine decarboxylase
MFTVFFPLIQGVTVMGLLRFLPLSYLSWFVGILANLPLPQPLARWTIQIFASAYGIDPTLATRPLGEFRSIGEFFTRDLKPEHRPIQGARVFPVDGTLRNVSDLSTDGSIQQVKGKHYTLKQLLAEDLLVERFSSGQLWNMYLSPKDAHHIYAPVSGTIVKTIHVPGFLWPVNDWALSSVDGLFAVNERIITFIESDSGLVAVIMVGATNVGRIALAYTQFETNREPWRRHQIRSLEHASGIQVRCGDKIGTLQMGSSVILVSEKPLAPEASEGAFPRAIRYGELLG